MPYLGKSPQHGNYSKLDDFSGDFDGSDATHAVASNGVAITPVRPEALIISINGVIQEPTTDYTVSGTNITFTTAPTAGDNFFGVAMGEQLAIGTPSDATVTSAKLSGNLVTPGTLDVNGQELILDANGNTSITADTDDQIDFKISGADDFRMTANNFNVLSGSTLTIDSGATITNSGTANNFGSDMESAYAGVLQTNANFVDQVIFGPAVDGRPWNGLWNKASLFSSLMLATIEDEGSNTEINIWDLTEQTSGTISTTPLGTVDLSSAATPTAIAACMGYLIVSSEDGIAIIDPHSGAWAERTTGWPRTLSTSTSPALTNNDVNAVAAGFSDQPAFDPRTGGPAPTFAVGYGTGADIGSLIKDDGNVWDRSGTVGNVGVGFINGHGIFANNDAQDGLWVTTMVISNINADDWDSQRATRDDGGSFGLVADNGFSVGGDYLASASSSGLNSLLYTDYFSGAKGINAITNRTYTTGYMVGDIRGAWLANSKTVDRSYKANTLTENGTVTEGAVESGAELNGYSNFTASNYFSRAYDADLDFGTGDFSVMGWFKQAASSTYETMIDRADTSPVQRFYIRLDDTGAINTSISDGSNGVTPTSTGQAYDDGVWHQAVLTFDGTAKTGTLYADGVQVATATNASIGSLSDGSAILRIGNLVNATTYPFNGTLALWRASATAPTATQIRQMYDAEKGMFVASAECLLQSGSTDAVIDVDVDPLTGKVLVTQTDAITVFDGLVVDSKPTVNSGASEKGKLWGALRSEQNAANAYVTAPAVDQRQVNEMVRGLASDLPAGPDLSKAKAWITFSMYAQTIQTSYNIKSITDVATGSSKVVFGVPFKTDKYVVIGSGAAESANDEGFFLIPGTTTENEAAIKWFNDGGSGVDTTRICVAFFGELENE